VKADRAEVAAALFQLGADRQAKDKKPALRKNIQTNLSFLAERLGRGSKTKKLLFVFLER
jgi:hypothetical protein